MEDDGWIVLAIVLVVGYFVWRRLSAHPNAPPLPKSAQEGETGPTRPHSIGKPTSPAISKPPIDSRPQPGRKATSRKRPWLIGPDREKWQKKQWEERQKELEEDREANREAAKSKAEEQRRLDEIEKAKSMTSAEARQAEIDARKKERQDRSGAVDQVDQERRSYQGQPIPRDVERDMKSFLDGAFVGPDQSPLTYVGYHVGEVRGLSEKDRHCRLEVCFRVPVPRQIYAEYRSWGEPVTTQRLNAMIAHLGRHAAMRSSRQEYHRAVSEWESDRVWLQETLGPKADRFTQRWDHG